MSRIEDLEDDHPVARSAAAEALRDARHACFAVCYAVLDRHPTDRAAAAAALGAAARIAMDDPNVSVEIDAAIAKAMDDLDGEDDE